MLPLALPLSLLPAALLNLPTDPASVFKAVDLAVYAADRQRDELLAGVKRSLLGEDALDALAPSQYALEPAASTVAVTGSTDGIGREAALFLARAGYGVVVCARDTAKGERVAADIRREALDSRVSVVELDLASVRSVEAAVPLIQTAATELGSPLRGLVLNAGVWPGKLQSSVDGMELALHACHIGHQQLTQRLLPDLQAAGGEARIVTVSSSAHAFASDAGLDDPLWASTAFDTNANYGRAKFANMLFAQELARRAPAGVVSTAAHPGLVLTTLFKELGPSYELKSRSTRPPRAQPRSKSRPTVPLWPSSRRFRAASSSPPPPLSHSSPPRPRRPGCPRSSRFSTARSRAKYSKPARSLSSTPPASWPWAAACRSGPKRP